MPHTIVQLCPRLDIGGIERGVIDVAIYLQDAGYESIVISHGGKLVSELINHQVKHIPLPIHSKNPLIFIMNLYRLYQILWAVNPDLILPYSRIPTWLIYFLRNTLKKPYITHCLGIHQMGRIGLKKLYNSVMIRNPWVLANSEFTKQYFMQMYGVSADKFTVIPRSVDLDFFDPKQIDNAMMGQLKIQWRVPPHKIVILLPARFTSWKGHEVLIQAIAHITRFNCQDFYVVLLGNFQQSNAYCRRLLKLTEKLSLSEIIFFAQDSGYMREAYAAADIIISASTEPEAFGRTIIEAQAMEKLVIATQHGGALEIIEDKKNGYLVMPGDITALADKILQVHRMSAVEKKRVQEQARINAQRYSKKMMCHQLRNLYCQVMDVNQDGRENIDKVIG